ncbi:hypothetical protein B0T21DRAFT_388369 [Apiosordaria backusii]|uniref:Uncharacterized protein n=1 Tax=Apiosordaria backusii TaxID=314023 RepID=A0AA40EXN7_9PEZI|nr:hypothetical protein B0T21DRAFT_388369 [Apiosordaria backusii]
MPPRADMTARVPTPNATGLPDPTRGSGPQRDILVPMTSRHNMRPAFTTGGADILWTSGLGDCIAIATWDMVTGERSLTHPNAGDVAGTGWADALAERINHNTIVIVANGTNSLNPSYFQDADFARVKNEVKAAMRRAGKRDPQFWMYHTREPSPRPRNLQMHSFVMYANGVFGRIGDGNTAVPGVTIVKEPATVRGPTR